jgi:hypothetical protein
VFKVNEQEIAMISNRWGLATTHTLIHMGLQARGANLSCKDYIASRGYLKVSSQTFPPPLSLSYFSKTLAQDENFAGLEKKSESN